MPAKFTLAIFAYVAAVYLTLGDFTLELLHYERPGNPSFRERVMNEPGLTHLSISVDNIKATAEKAVEYGGEIIDESDVGVALMIRDPDGQLLELLTAGFPGSRPPRP